MGSCVMTTLTVMTQDGDIRRQRLRSRTRERLTRLGFLGPFYVAFVLFFLAPIGYAIYQSLYSPRRVGGLFGKATQAFTGFGQYRTVLSDHQFLSGVLRVVLFAVIQVPLMAIIAVTLALILDATAPKIARIFRTSFFMPYAVSTVVATLMWGALYTPGTSPLTEFHLHLNALGPSLILPSIANIGIWEWGGFNVIIMTTALTAIPTEIFEAARIDGASTLGTALRIKVPLIRPTIIMSMVLSIIGTLQLFTEPQVLSVDSNAITTYFTPNMLAYSALTGDNYHFAAAISVTLAAVGFVLSFAFLRIARREAR
jgi:multiple sugar transport system permease protein